MEDQKVVPLKSESMPDEFKLNLVLPLTKRKVVVTCPSWGDRKRAKASVKAVGGDGEDTIELMLAGCIEVDGKPLNGPEDFAKWPVHDFTHLMEEFGNWGMGPDGTSKN